MTGTEPDWSGLDFDPAPGDPPPERWDTVRKAFG